MTSHESLQRRFRSGACLIGSLIALGSSLGLAALPAYAQADPGFVPVTGTWTRGGTDTVAWLDLATWKLVTSTEGGQPFEDPQPQPWIPVAGDWDGDGVDTVQMFNIHDWRLVPAERGPQSDSSEPQPVPWVPVAGDWDGHGIDTVLVFDQRDSSLHRLEEGPIPVERYDPQPQPWQPAAGDWDGDGLDTLATFREVPTAPAPAPIWVTVFGDWDGNGIDSEAALHMPSGQLVQAEQESLIAPSTSAAAGHPAALFGAVSNGPGLCFKLIKNKKTTYGKKEIPGGGCIGWYMSSWEEWTCCPTTPDGNYKCGMQLKFGGGPAGC